MIVTVSLISIQNHRQISLCIDACFQTEKFTNSSLQYLGTNKDIEFLVIKKVKNSIKLSCVIFIVTQTFAQYWLTLTFVYLRKQSQSLCLIPHASSNINEVIRSVFNFYFFFLTKKIHKYKKAQNRLQLTKIKNVYKKDLSSNINAVIKAI